jgi:polyphosphate kinase 2 (PPK2 family)
VKVRSRRSLRGLSVKELDDDEAVLLDSDGREITTWQQDYPYTERMSRAEYEHTKRSLQIELLKMQSWVKDSGQRIVVLFEGRDAVGKGGTIKRFTEAFKPARSAGGGVGEAERTRAHPVVLPALFQPVARCGRNCVIRQVVVQSRCRRTRQGFCTTDEYEEFLEQTPGLERALVDTGIHLVKLWFSVSRTEQRTRFIIRVIDPIRQWKLSPVDLASLDRWDDYTQAKETMFQCTDTPAAPWTVVKSNDKKRGRIAALRLVLSTLEYPAKDPDVIGTPDPLIVGPPAQVYEQNERNN